jgi:hypothetical protein
VFFDDNLYLAKVESGGDYSFAIFEDTHLSTSNNVIIDALGLGYDVVNFIESSGTTAEQAELNSTLFTDVDNTVTSMQGFSINLVSSGVFSTNTTLTEITLRTDLNNYNGQWKDLLFNGLEIDAGLNLSAIDEDGCSIVGAATNAGDDIFNFSVNYSGCAKSGDYEGVLTLADKSSHVELSWMAFDVANKKGVFGSVDTKLTQDESLPLTGELLPSVYLSTSSVLVAISGRIYTVQYNPAGSTFNPSFFDYTYEDAPPAFISGTGAGLYQDPQAADGIAEVDSSLSFETSEGMEKISATITFQDTIAVDRELTYSNLSYIPSDSTLSSISGTWGPVVITADGNWSGNVGGCNSTGIVTEVDENIFNVSVTLSACPESANNTDYSGVLVAINGDVFSRSNNVLVAILSSADKRRGFSGLINQ